MVVHVTKGLVTLLHEMCCRSSMRIGEKELVSMFKGLIFGKKETGIKTF